MSNIYYNPDHFGLEIVAELDLNDVPYQFDMVIVWKDTVEKLWWAGDDGCSCPSPFEDMGLADLNPLPETIAQLKESVSRGDFGDVSDFFRKVIPAMGWKEIE